MPCASLRGYKLSQLPGDLVAGAIVTALTLPISMEYANIVGMPAIYGLYASIVATLAFALVTSTRHLVFSMDSATSAVAGTTLMSMGLAFESQSIIDVMPLFTLLTAAFLLLFAVLRVGKFVRYVPSPVMHGFIAGISLAVIIAQIPTLLGTGYSDSTTFPFGSINIVASIPNANPASAAIAIVSLALLVICKKLIPKAPGSLIVLALATVATALLALDSHGVNTLGAIDAGLPTIALPKLDVVNPLFVVGGSFTVAVVITIESLLCLETFSIKTGKRSTGNREVLSFAIANAAAGLFGCPPCSASISRTAAGMDAHGSSQVVSIASAVFVCAVLLVLSPFLYYLPRPALSAIVVMALIGVVDYKRIASYARHAKLEFGVFLLTAIVVFIWGAIAGVAVGTILSLGVMRYRNKRAGQDVMLGLIASSGKKKKKKRKNTRPNTDVPYSVFSFKGKLTFLNVDKRIDRILERLDPTTKAVILKTSKVSSIDVTATDKLVQFIELLHARGLHVKLVRKMRPTDDAYTRHELRMVLGEAKVYPNLREAIEGIKRDFSDQRIEVEMPFLTIEKESETKSSKLFDGRIRFPKSEQKLLFNIDVDTQTPRKRRDEAFSSLSIADASNNEKLVEYSQGTWTWNSDDENLKRAVRRLRAFAETQS